MKRFQCDVCGLLVGEYNLSKIHNSFQIKEKPHPLIEHICGDCNEQILNANNNIDKALEPIKNSWMKEIILKLRWKKWSND
jgi:hypothetical protein